MDKMIAGIAFALWCSWMLLFMITMVVSESGWWQLRKARKQLFGEQRVQILKKMLELKSLRARIGDPEGKMEEAIQKCRENLKKLDLAVVRMHESAACEVEEQCKEVDWMLAECSGDPTTSRDVPSVAELQRQPVSRGMAIQ